MRRVAKAIETNPLRVAGQPQGAIADQSRAEQWRRLQVRIVLRQWKTEALIGDEVLRIAAIEVIAGEFRLQAQVLETAPAEAAGFVNESEPGHADSLFRRKAVRAIAPPGDVANHHVPDDEWQLGVQQLAVDDVKIGAADGADGDLDQDLLRARAWDGQVFEAQRLSDGAEAHRLHAPPP